MRILMLTTNSSLLDGINRHILTIARALKRCPSVEVAVCTVFPDGELNVELQNSGVQSYSLGAPHGHSPKIFSGFHQVMKAFNPDIVHAHVLALFEQIELSLLYRGRKVVRTFHGLGGRPPLRKRLLDFFFKVRYDADCFISKGVQEYYRKLGVPLGRISEVVYNPMAFVTQERKCAGSLQAILGVDPDTLVIGSACRIADVKNPVAMLDVMCRVLRSVPRAHAVLIGDGPAEVKSKITDFLDSQDVADRIHLLGYRSDAAALMKALSCFVMTSRSEGMPTALLEAIAARTPIAFFKGGGGLIDLAELNDHHGPFAVTAAMDDCAGLAKGIEEMLLRPEMAEVFADRAFAVGRKVFNVDAIGAQLLNLYEKVMSR